MEYKTFFLTDEQEGGKNHLTGLVFSRLAGDRPKKSHLVVKVLITKDDDQIRVHNEDASLYGQVIEEYTPAEAKEIKEKIKEEGKDGDGFFYAIVPKDGEKRKDGVNVVEMKINIQKMQPIEAW